MREIMSFLFTYCLLVYLHASIFLPLTTGNRLDCLHTNHHSQTQSKKRIWADCDSTRRSLCPWIRWVFITMKCKEKKKRSAVGELGRVKDQTMTIANDTWCARMTNICFERTRLASLWIYDSVVSQTRELFCACKACNRKILRQIQKLTSLGILQMTPSRRKWRLENWSVLPDPAINRPRDKLSFPGILGGRIFVSMELLPLALWDLQMGSNDGSFFISRNVTNVPGKSARDETRAVVLRWLFKFLAHIFSCRNLPNRVAMYVIWY